MRSFRAILAFLFTIAVIDSTAAGEDAGVEFFEKKIRPVLVEHCYECHGVDGNAVGKQSPTIEGGLRLDFRDGLLTGGDSGPALAPGKPEESLLLDALRYGDDSLQMPPDGQLPAEVIADFAEWIEMGAPDPRERRPSAPSREGRANGSQIRPADLWSLQPIVKPAVPVVKNDSWPRSDIDRFVLARQEAENLQPVRDADPLILLRRLHYDLTGLPPTPETIADFEKRMSATKVGSASDSALHIPHSALADEVDRLLASPAFGERWGRHWLDIARYADTNGGGPNFTFDNAWRYRDYVIAAFNADKPYDRFLTEQIAGDLLPHENAQQRSEQLIATGFLLLGPKELAEYDKAKVKMDVIDEQLDTLGRAVLGMTLGCVRCHDHKFDPLKQDDYYALAGILSSTASLKTKRKTGIMTDWQRVALPVGADQQQQAKAAHEKLRRSSDGLRNKAQNEVKSLEKQLAAARQSDAGDVEKIERLVSTLASARAKVDNYTAMKSVLGYTDAVPVAMAVSDEAKPVDEPIRIRGEVHNRSKRVSRGLPPSLLADEHAWQMPSKQSGRLQLAQWLTADDNPLTARVMVNRVWHHLFATGLVRTTDNFGLRGETPSHPQLLDYLAATYREDGWSTKRLIRRIVLSRTYQLAVVNHPQAKKADVDNRLLWRAHARRLDAEAIRDSILHISGGLDRTVGGRTLMFSGRLGFARNYYTIPDFPSPWLRRSVYLPVIRGEVMPQTEMFATFDMADANVTTGNRSSTTVPAQALFLMNSQLVQQHARKTAQRLLNDETQTDEARVDTAFRRILCRPCTAEERTASLTLIEEIERGLYEADTNTENRVAAWASFCQSLMACNEFLFLN